MATDRTNAPLYNVPQARIVSIEHPCLLRSLDNGIKSLGDEPQIKHVLEHRVGETSDRDERKAGSQAEPVVGASFRPDDPFAKKIASVAVGTSNILVRVTCPKRTGRKRKRGSDEPFQHDAEPPRPLAATPTLDMLRSLQDNVRRSTIEPVGFITDTHRFRSLPDFQLRAVDQAIMQEVKTHVIGGRYSDVRKFHVDLKEGPYQSDYYPGPPAFMSVDQPYNYEWQQAPSVVYTNDADGNPISVNSMSSSRLPLQNIGPDNPEIPTGPPAGAILKAGRDGQAHTCLQELTKLLNERPLVSKRVIFNTVTKYGESVVKDAMPYVGYSFKKGPFRDLLVKHGVDPRKDPQYRKYQTLYFQYDKDLVRKSRLAKNPRHLKDNDLNGHIFDGTTISTKGMTWQVCDAIDPLITEILSTDHIRTEFDYHQYGWFHAGTLVKARVLMRDKMKRILAQCSIPNEEYRPLLQIPDKIDQESIRLLYFDDRQLTPNIAGIPVEIRGQLRSTEASRRDKGLGEEVPNFVDHDRGGETGSPAAMEEDDEQGDLDGMDADEGAENSLDQ